jgi:prepilin-type N-terminal cleavage/methylation domain-containing protein
MAAASRLGAWPRARLDDEHGFTLIESLVVIVLLVIVVGAALDLLQAATSAQSRDQSYAQEVTDAQTGLTRLVHDLRQATAFQLVSPNKVQFQMVANGTTYNVLYDCTASDTLGTGYRRCARTQNKAPGAPGGTGSTSGPDIAHVANGTIATFCNSGGSAPSGSVFFVQNPHIANTDGSGLACDEAYENLIGPQLRIPTYVQVLLQVPASGDLVRGGMRHLIVLQSGAFLPNSDPGA